VRQGEPEPPIALDCHSALAFSNRLVVIADDLAVRTRLYATLYSQTTRDGLVVLQIHTANFDIAPNTQPSCYGLVVIADDLAVRTRLDIAFNLHEVSPQCNYSHRIGIHYCVPKGEVAELSVILLPALKFFV
jgi:hypothetical protein